MQISGFGSAFQLQQTRKRQDNLFEQLSSGKRVNSAKDDPSALALSNALESASRGLATANKSISYAQGALSTAGGALQQQAESLQRARELAVQASNGTLSSQDRSNLQKEFSQVVQSVDQTSSQTSFAGKNLLDGSFQTSVLVGSDGQSASVSLDSSSAENLGLASADISTQSGAEDALAQIDTALANVNAQQAEIGAQQNAFEFSSNANAVQAENLAAAKSTASDADLADTLSSVKREAVLMQAQLTAFTLKNKGAKDEKSSLLAKL